MKYFQLKPSYNHRIKEDLIEDYLLPCHKDEPYFLGNHNNSSLINFIPKIPRIKISDKRKIPSFFYAGGMLSRRLIMSDDLKNCIEEFNKNSKIQFLPIELIHQEKIIEYWITNYTATNDNCIDFNETTFISVISKTTGNSFIQLDFEHQYEKKKFPNLEMYKSYKSELKLKNGSITPEKLHINMSCIEDIILLKEVFMLDMIISERIRNRILEEKIFELEFKPLELTEEEWFGPNGLRNQFYS